MSKLSIELHFKLLRCQSLVILRQGKVQNIWEKFSAVNILVLDTFLIDSEKNVGKRAWERELSGTLVFICSHKKDRQISLRTGKMKIFEVEWYSRMNFARRHTSICRFGHNRECNGWTFCLLLYPSRLCCLSL